MPLPVEIRKASFIERAQIVHAGENLDYSQVEYVDNRTPVKIIDPEFGEFWQTPSNHLKGQKHPKRKPLTIAANKRSKQEEIIRRFQEVHAGENLDYSRVKYVNMHTKVEIICHELRPDGTEYGSFWQEPVVHLKGCTHPDLSIYKNSQSQRLGTLTFIERAKVVHFHKNYSYEAVKYTNQRGKVKIYCHHKDGKGREHGYFMIAAGNCLAGQGCPKCGNSLSVGEDELYKFITEELGITDVHKRVRNLVKGYELDLFIPSQNIAIEYNGLRWHSELFHDRNYHINKTNECAKYDIRLIHIFEDEWQQQPNIVKSRLANILNCQSNRIFARKCKLKEVDSKTAGVFLETNHLQGRVNGKYRYGLYYHEELVSLMTFGNLRKPLGNTKQENVYELLRFCNKLGTAVIGGASRLLSHFIKAVHPGTIISYADKRWSIGHLYETLGFRFSHNSQPSYFYIINGERINRFSMRKDILVNKYGCPSDMSEHQFCLSKKWYRIYDCGTACYIWKNANKDDM